MSFRLIILPPAEKDLTKAYKWYEEQLTGLGRELVDEETVVIFAVVHSRRHPDLFKLRVTE